MQAAAGVLTAGQHAVSVLFDLQTSAGGFCCHERDSARQAKKADRASKNVRHETDQTDDENKARDYQCDLHHLAMLKIVVMVRH